ncbi:MAG: hypothetical protein E6Q97_14575 [Desulfurellales bacterium]|nr:MAG: hypothetical protein E6Q97_14575 [Desulfurellales bacterium]
MELSKEQRDALKSINDWHRSLTAAVVDGDDAMMRRYLYWLATSCGVAARKLGVDLEQDTYEAMVEFEKAVA